MNAPIVPPFPINPEVGQVFQSWVWNGSAWVCRGSGPVLQINYFPVGGIYYPAPGLTFAVVECVGGGGGSGGAQASWTGSTTDGWITGGGGGSSGNYSKSTLAAALLRGGVPITIGAGGAAGTSNSAGGPGGATSFGQFVVALGGHGGNWNQFIGLSTTSPAWGQGGSRNVNGDGSIPAGSAGDLQFCGNAGNQGQAQSVIAGTAVGLVHGGLGGVSFFGGTGQAFAALGSNAVVPPESPGTPGFFGAGATGGASGINTSPALGGPGGGGLCIVSEWIFGSNALVEDCGCGASSGVARVALTDGPGWRPNFQYDYEGR